uniref:Uncharacterized protein n=1 Tax=Oryza rufipogon TaxID=4529 RepID=A0A0E0P7K8_ORYRU
MVLQSWPEDNNGSSATFTFFRDKPRWSRQGMLLTYTVSPTATDDHLAKEGIRGTIKIVYMNIWFDEFDSSANSIRMEHGIKGKRQWMWHGMLLTYAMSPMAINDQLTRDVVREASCSSMFRQLYLEANEAYAKPSRLHT